MEVGTNSKHFAVGIVNVFSWKKSYFDSEFPVSFFPSRGPLDDKSALVQVIAWRPTGDKLMTEPMMTWVTDEYMCRQASLN